jgi:hypothetical protein
MLCYQRLRALASCLPRAKEPAGLYEQQRGGWRAFTGREAAVTKTPRRKSDKLLDALEAAVLLGLKSSETGKERNDNVANGIKLLAIKHRIAGNEDDGDYFGGDES